MYLGTVKLGSKERGHTGIRPKSVGTCTCAWKSSRQRSRPAAGRPRSASAHGIASSWPKAKMPIRSSSPLPENEVPSCGPLPSTLPGHQQQKADGGLTHTLSRFPTSIGRGAAPVWCNPRRRYEADRYSRP